MGIFNNKKKENKKIDEAYKLPRLPEIPKLPEMTEDNEFDRDIHPLPKFSTDSLGQKFSQNTIKEAITGKKEERTFANEFAHEDEMQMMQESQLAPPMPQKERLTMEVSPSYEPRRVRETAEPIFIRIDKFEEGLHALENARKQISEVEKILREIRKTKEEEEKELNSWEKEIQTAKEQIEKIDREIFSKLE